MSAEVPHPTRSFTVPLLFSLLVANPAALFLLFGSFFWALVSLILVFLIAIWAFKRKSHWYSVYILNSFVLISVLFHGELVFRFGFSDYVIEDLYDLEPNFYFNKPNLFRVLTDKEFSVLYKTNSQGFRIGESMLQEHTVTNCDWLVIGDSYTQGAQVDFEELYTSRLYEYFPDKIIVNAGVSGFGIPEELEFYRTIGRSLKPSKVFLQVCNFNDFMKVELGDYGVTEYMMQYSDLARSLLYGLKYKTPGELPLGRWTEPFYPAEEDNAEFNIFYKPSTDRKKRDIENFERLLIEFAEETRNDGVELIVLLLPTKEQIYYEDFSEVVSEFHIDVANLNMDFPNRLVQRICLENEISLIDLTETYASKDERVFFNYDEHLNREGHIVTAKALEEHLRQRPPTQRVSLLSRSFSGDRYPSYVSGGRSVLFQSNRDGNSEVFLSDDAFENTVRITTNNVDESHPTATKDGQNMVMTVGDPTTLKTKVEIMNIKGGNRRKITGLFTQFGGIPVFSRDDRKIGFAEWFYDESTDSFTQPQIVVVDLDGSKLYQVTDDSFEHWRPVFGPRDEFLIYISKIDDQFDLYQYFIEDQRELQLTATPYDEWDPQISPDGRNVVYAGRKDGNWDLFELVLADGSTRQLTQTKGTEWDPNYSPDGKKIIYAGEYGQFRGIYTLERSEIEIQELTSANPSKKE